MDAFDIKLGFQYYRKLVKHRNILLILQRKIS